MATNRDNQTQTAEAVSSSVSTGKETLSGAPQGRKAKRQAKRNARRIARAQRKAKKEKADLFVADERAEHTDHIRRRVVKNGCKTLRAQRKADRENEISRRLKKLAEKQKPEAEWTHFDNAAIIFPASENADMLNMYRLTAVLKEPVQPLPLQQALNDLVLRFPTMTSAVKKGFFWWYLEPSDKPLTLVEQSSYPCRKIPVDSRNALIRVTYYHCEISVEFFHVATDANGGFIFLNSLVAHYLQLLGHTLTDHTNVLNPFDKPRTEELTDSFQKFADGVTPRRGKDSRAYSIVGHTLPSYALVLTKGIMSAEQLNKVAKRYGMTVGQLCTACLIWAIEEDRLENNRRRRHEITVSLPVNLRKIHPSKTLRNFMSLMPVHSNVSGTFDDLMEEVKAQFADKNTEDYFKGLVNYNIKVQHNPLVQIIPLPLKMIVLKIALRFMSDRVTTTLFSNVGRVSVPQNFSQYVSRLEFSFGPQSYAGVALSAATFEDTAVFTFARSIREHGVEKHFFRKLVELGVDVTVECNDEKL